MSCLDSDLVDVVARFTPRIVRLAEAGEQPEDCPRRGRR